MHLQYIKTHVLSELFCSFSNRSKVRSRGYNMLGAVKAWVFCEEGCHYFVCFVFCSFSCLCVCVCVSSSYCLR